MPSPRASLPCAMIALMVAMIFRAAASKPAWTASKCWWNAPSEECLSWPLHTLKFSLSSKCAKTTIEDKSSCEAEKYIDGDSCLWNSDDDHCHAPDCTLFDEVVCKGSVGVANSCQWGDFSCEPLKCSNQASLSTEETCNESSGVGPCKWSTAFNGCQAFSCSDYTKEADCNADASKVLPMTFLLGAAPYGKTPCVWKGSSCSQIYQCAEYDNEGLCQADPAGFGKCEWHSDVSKCTDMITCSAYSSQGACETDTYKAAQRTHPSAKCWWSPGPAVFTVGEAVELTGIWQDQGPIATSGNLKVEKRLLKTLDGKDAMLGMALGISITGLLDRQVLEVRDGNGVVQDLSSPMNPVPDGYTIKLNGECADNEPGLMDYVGGPECDERVDQTTCELATTSEQGPSPPGPPGNQASSSPPSTSAVAEASAAWKHTSLTKMIGILFFAVAWSVGA